MSSLHQRQHFHIAQWNKNWTQTHLSLICIQRFTAEILLDALKVIFWLHSCGYCNLSFILTLQLFNSAHILSLIFTRSWLWCATCYYSNWHRETHLLMSSVSLYKICPCNCKHTFGLKRQRKITLHLQCDPRKQFENQWHRHVKAV